MKGYLWAPSAATQVRAEGSSWESMAVDAVGNVIEFWGFKRNQGRVWALLYLRGEAMTAAELEKELELSKGGVSMLIRDLERWGVVLRVRVHGDASWRYRAETDLLQMARRVIEEREFTFIARIRADLAEARALAEQDHSAPREKIDRIRKMEALAEATEKALTVFLKTSRFDVGAMFDLFRP